MYVPSHGVSGRETVARDDKRIAAWSMSFSRLNLIHQKWRIHAVVTTPRTRDLSYVGGTVTDFRYYTGAPLNTAAGIPIGTVFVMSGQPSSGLKLSQQQLLTDTAETVMRQLTLTLQALDGERLIRFQSATAALLQRQQLFLHQGVFE
jgi:hypothetical protein